MARKDVTPPEGDGKDDFMPIKVRRETWRLLKSLAAWREMPLAEYVDAVCAGRSVVDDDLKQMASEMTKMGKERT